MKKNQKSAARETVFHRIEPTFNEESRVLILGSFPSRRSRESGYYYGHPQNRFWRVLAGVFEEEEPKTNAEKKAFVLRRRLALWDVAASCDISGSSDGSIRSAAPNDLSLILKRAKIERILLNGSAAGRLYEKFFADSLALPSLCLPSTSPANARWSLSDLIGAWRPALKGASDAPVADARKPAPAQEKRRKHD